MGTVVQGKMYRVVAGILLVFGLIQAYPTGAPSCTNSPGHGTSTGNITAEVTNIGGNEWQIDITESHKGLVINAETPGDWDESSVVPGYQVDGASFIFKTDSAGQPQFSGFLVHDFTSYGAI